MITHTIPFSGLSITLNRNGSGKRHILILDHELDSLATSLKQAIPHCGVCIGESKHLRGLLGETEAVRAAGFSSSRSAEFIGGRTAAKRAAYQIGIAINDIPTLPNGAPDWPGRLTGSISHKNHVCGALVAKKKYHKSVGLDIENVQPLDEDVWSAFTTMEEVSQFRRCNVSAPHFANMLFSAKESFFKCLYPIFSLAAPPLDEIYVSIKGSNGKYAISSTVEGKEFHGGLLMSGMLIVSWAVAS